MAVRICGCGAFKVVQPWNTVQPVKWVCPRCSYVLHELVPFFVAELHEDATIVLERIMFERVA